MLLFLRPWFMLLCSQSCYMLFENASTDRLLTLVYLGISTRHDKILHAEDMQYCNIYIILTHVCWSGKSLKNPNIIFLRIRILWDAMHFYLFQFLCCWCRTKNPVLIERAWRNYAKMGLWKTTRVVP